MSISRTSAATGLYPTARIQPKAPSFGQTDSNPLEELFGGAPKGLAKTEHRHRAEQSSRANAAQQNGEISSAADAVFDAEMADQRLSMQFLTQQLSAQEKSDIFTATDADGSGGVDIAEFSAETDPSQTDQASLQGLFDLIDENGDGSINGTETSSFFDQVTSALNEQFGPESSGDDGSLSRMDEEGSDAAFGQPDQAETSINLLNLLARNAYQSKTSSSDLLTTLTGLLNHQA